MPSNKPTPEPQNVSGQISAMKAEILERVDILRNSIGDRLNNMDTKMQHLNDYISGGDSPERGIFVRLDRLEQKNIEELDIRIDRLEQKDDTRTKLTWVVIVAAITSIFTLIRTFFGAGK